MRGSCARAWVHGEDACSDHPPSSGTARKAIHPLRWGRDPLDHRSGGAGLSTGISQTHPHLDDDRSFADGRTEAGARAFAVELHGATPACSAPVVTGERFRGLGNKWSVSSVLRFPRDGSGSKAAKATLEVRTSCWRRSSICGGHRKSCPKTPLEKSSVTLSTKFFLNS